MALVTAAEVRDYIPGLTGTAEDTLLDTLIARAGAALAHYCAFEPASDDDVPSLESTSYTRYVNAPDPADPRRIQLPHRPLVEVTSVHDDADWAHGASTLVSTDDYVVDKRAGEIRLKPNTSHAFSSDGRSPRWSDSEQTIKVVYTAGYATIPDDLKQACVLLVQHWWELRTAAGEQARTFDGNSVTRIPRKIPSHVLELVAPYRLWEHCVA